MQIGTRRRSDQTATAWEPAFPKLLWDDGAGTRWVSLGGDSAAGGMIAGALRLWQPADQAEEVAYRNDLGARVQLEAQQVPLVTGHEKVRRTGSGPTPADNYRTGPQRP
jgi:hypothetical protein